MRAAGILNEISSFNRVFPLHFRCFRFSSSVVHRLPGFRSSSQCVRFSPISSHNDDYDDDDDSTRVLRFLWLICGLQFLWQGLDSREWPPTRWEVGVSCYHCFPKVWMGWDWMDRDELGACPRCGPFAKWWAIMEFSGKWPMGKVTNRRTSGSCDGCFILDVLS